ncbi:unnamed protein product, partial [marine sediment metagenome]
GALHIGNARMVILNSEYAKNKKLKGMNKTNSDNYYLRKLKSIVREKLKEAEYYAILRDILEK